MSNNRFRKATIVATIGFTVGLLSIYAAWHSAYSGYLVPAATIATTIPLSVLVAIKTRAGSDVPEGRPNERKELNNDS